MSVPTDQVRERIAQAKARLKQQIAQQRANQLQLSEETPEKPGSSFLPTLHIEEQSASELPAQQDSSFSKSAMHSSGRKTMPAWRMAQIDEISKRRSGISVGACRSASDSINTKTQVLLDRFRSSLKKTTAPVEISEDTNGARNFIEKTAASDGILDESRAPCALHFVSGCKSCAAASPTTENVTQAEAEHGWQSHLLFFEKEAGERQLKTDAENLLVIDPRERMATLQPVSKRTRK
ncbi:Peptidyl-prolyl isomerase cwc27 [Mitosporidium daphniae]|uniref:Uncharacterized protein n=1 Tax=Mitosporidium daphniae TaxID=1485682 RepID=A0A098VTJ7_9MICR|nr:uncharacterized protein DI09_38p120 [Mitosporidium daphniae]XP_013238721.1 uncharacterized protein DI09_192p40 [Mitosporidium daphniae]KGG51342.1 hypothetical protein DI09_38p120 [Mitosporidium daphniae]KGG52285.1 hypothetical protein DI09_192p40 [Mitosporidium daphniae]|eukprot:XP_013237769.1 uncharacterized protein DI09_38p120 [Mitosporidium daphniae]